MACSTEPVPLVYGTDVCRFCKMTLTDQKFGGELVTVKGKVYKFDDVRCLLNYYNTSDEKEEDYKHRLVIDYAQPGKLINAADAFYLKSAQIHSPMDGGVAAFSEKVKMDAFKHQQGGIYLAWGEVITQFK